MAAATTGKLVRLTLFAIAAGCIGIAIGLAFMSQAWRDSRPPDKAKAFPAGEIVVAVDASIPPFAADDGQSVYGLDIDLAHAIAKKIDLPLRFVHIGFYGLYDALISNQADMLISALRTDPARRREVRFTQPYFDNGLVLVTPQGSPVAMIESMPGHRIAYEFGSIADAEVRHWERRIGQMQRFPYEQTQYALDAVRLDHADAALVDATSYRLYRREHPNWLSQSRFITHDVYAVALRIDRAAAWKLVDNALTALKESGELDTIIADWL